MKIKFCKIEQSKTEDLKKKVKKFEQTIFFIKDFREFCKLNNVDNKEEINLLCSEKEIKFLEENRIIICSIFNIRSFELEKNFNQKDIKNFVSSNMKFGVYLNVKANKEAINDKINFYENEILFFTKKLSNKNFVKNAPAKIVNEQRKKLALAEKSLEILRNNLKK